KARVVQLNADGQFHIYNVSDTSHIVGGYYLDDEIVLYDDRRYFDSTPEGAHHVFLRFPEISGVYSFQQFQRALRRPDIIRAALAGKTLGDDPKLSLPPTLSIDGEVRSRSSKGIDAALTIKGKAKVEGLSELRIFADGHLLQKKVLSG